MYCVFQLDKEKLYVMCVLLTCTKQNRYKLAESSLICIVVLTLAFIVLYVCMSDALLSDTSEIFSLNKCNLTEIVIVPIPDTRDLQDGYISYSILLY